MKNSPWIIAASALLLALGAATATAAPLKVLILSGANNHDWRTTTPLLKATLEESGRFAVDVETNVAAMTAASFAPYDVVLSNFNTFGRKNAGEVWGADVREAFAAFIRKGRGLVVVHAGSSVFYDWPDFQKIAGTSWGAKTSHGKMHTNEVRIVDSAHPVTAGVKAFTTFDEYWQNVPLAEGAGVLAETAPSKEYGGSGKSEPMALVTKFGDGRGFTLLLGHDARAMQSEGFKTLLRRGTEWAATGGVAK